MPEIFAGDSFFTLSVPGRIGLLILSLVMLLSTGWVAFKLGCITGMIGGAIGAAMIYWAFLWIAPQVYYTYYIAIFDSLPWQWVIGRPPTPRPLLVQATFQGKNDLSEISQGAGFWLVLLAGVWGGRRKTVV